MMGSDFNFTLCVINGLKYAKIYFGLCFEDTPQTDLLPDGKLQFYNVPFYFSLIYLLACMYYLTFICMGPKDVKRCLNCLGFITTTYIL